MRSLWPRTVCCCRTKSCGCRAMAVSTFMLPSCHAGGVRRRSSAHCSPVMPRVEFPSCTWSALWIPGRFMRAGRFASSRRKHLRDCTSASRGSVPGRCSRCSTQSSAGTAVAQPQTGPATYAARIEKSEALIDWSHAAEQIERQVRAFDPWPIAETIWRGQKLRIWTAHVVPLPCAARPGTVLASDVPTIVVGVWRRSVSARRRPIAWSQAAAGA